MDRQISREDHDARVTELLIFANAMEERARQADRLARHLQARFEFLISDDPTFDATDGAHPAWWRGNDRGIEAVTKIVHDILDGQDVGGTFASANLTKLRERLVAMVAILSGLEKIDKAS